MTKEQIANKQQTELHGKLWTMVNDLRGSMEAYEFKNYILSVLFYKFLSEKFVEKLMTELGIDNIEIYFEEWENDREAALEVFAEEYDYYIEPQYLFSSIIKRIKDETFDIEFFHGAINQLIETTQNSSDEEVVKVFENLFEDMDLTSTKLGRTVNARSKLMAKILKTMDTLDIRHAEAEIDILGDSYEYLISKFASTAGKKAGEFYTPAGPSRLLAKLATVNKKVAKTIYDPTAGSGSLLLRVAEELENDNCHYYAQELTSTTYNLCRMNMLLHNINPKYIHIANGDTIEDDKHADKKFDVQVANPPYSVNWSRADKFKKDPRFSDYGKLPYKSKADFAFVQHMLYHMADDGHVAVLLPHGVLFRSGAEKTIRKHIIDKLNYLDAVVGLPENLFFGTSIPVVALVFKKNRNGDSDNVLFIDASKEFGEKKNQNILREEDIEKIVETYRNREALERYSHVATLEEIKENDYNLNIPRYVDTFEPEPRINLEQVRKNINNLDEEHEEIKKTIKGFFEELGLDREVN